VSIYRKIEKECKLYIYIYKKFKIVYNDDQKILCFHKLNSSEYICFFLIKIIMIRSNTGTKNIYFFLIKIIMIRSKHWYKKKYEIRVIYLLFFNMKISISSTNIILC